MLKDSENWKKKKKKKKKNSKNIVEEVGSFQVKYTICMSACTTTRPSRPRRQLRKVKRRKTRKGGSEEEGKKINDGMERVASGLTLGRQSTVSLSV